MSESPGSSGSEERVRRLRRARAEWAISRIRRRMKRVGLHAVTLDEIDARIHVTRNARRRMELAA